MPRRGNLFFSLSPSAEIATLCFCYVRNDVIQKHEYVYITRRPQGPMTKKEKEKITFLFDTTPIRHTIMYILYYFKRHNVNEKNKMLNTKDRLYVKNAHIRFVNSARCDKIIQKTKTETKYERRNFYGTGGNARRTSG